MTTYICKNGHMFRTLLGATNCARCKRPAGYAAKARHVVQAKQVRSHSCHWPGCTVQVAPAKWGCLAHWRRLPKAYRDKIWSMYRIGQEITASPSREYVKVAREVQAWIAQTEEWAKGL